MSPEGRPQPPPYEREPQQQSSEFDLDQMTLEDILKQGSELFVDYRAKSKATIKERLSRGQQTEDPHPFLDLELALVSLPERDIDKAWNFFDVLRRNEHPGNRRLAASYIDRLGARCADEDYHRIPEAWIGLFLDSESHVSHIAGEALKRAINEQTFDAEQLTWVVDEMTQAIQMLRRCAGY